MSGNSSATDHPAAPPLAGCRVVVTRAPEQARPLVARLEELGAVPLPCPAIRIEPPDDPAPLDEALRRIDRYDWVAFTSANAVRAVGARLAWLGLPRSALGPARLAAVGHATAEAMTFHLRPPDLVPEVHSAEGLAAAFARVAGLRFLLPASDIARETLAAALRARGAEVTLVTAYRTVAAPELARIGQIIAAGRVDAILFASPSAAQYFVEGLAAAGLSPGDLLAQAARPAVVCIGPTTAAAASDVGLPVDAVAREQTSDGLVDALVDYMTHRERDDGTR